MHRKLIRSVLPRSLIDRVKSSAIIHRLFDRRRSDRVTVVSVGVGAGLRFDPGPSNPAYGIGSNELPVQQALVKHLKPNHVFYDVGANVGFFTVISARLVGPGGRVYAFEPVPINASFVRRNAALNGCRNITVVPKAVSDVSGKGDFVLAAYSGGGALAVAAEPPDATGRISVDLVSIDDLVFRGGMEPPSMVKIDVEGAELEVLQGMARTMLAFKPVVLYEIDDAEAELACSKRDACDAFVRSLGYRVSELEESYPDIQWVVKHSIAEPA